MIARDAAIGIVIKRTGWGYERAASWLAAEVAFGTICPELDRHWPPYRLVEIEAALGAAQRSTPAAEPPDAILPVRRSGRPPKNPGEKAGERRLAMIDQGMSMEDIAEKEGVDIETIRRSMGKDRTGQ